MKPKFILLFSLIFVILVLISIYFLFLAKKGPAPFAPQVVIIGLDGASWNFINPLLRENALPNIKYLIENGSSGVLETIVPTKSSVIWTSIATGKSMIKHGIVDWTFVDKNKIQVPYRQSERRAKAFWNIFGDLGRTVGVINWFITYPPEHVNGYMVSEEFRSLTRRDFSKIKVTHPRGLQKKLEFASFKDFGKIQEDEHIPDYRRWQTSGKGAGDPLTLIPFYPRYVFENKTIELASLYLFERFPVDIFTTYFQLIDVVSHFASSYLDPELLEKGITEEKEGKLSQETLISLDQAFSKIVAPIYSYLDKILGKFLKLSNPEATFIIVSDHGFSFHKGGYGHSDMPQIPHGIILIKGPQIKKGYSIQKAHIYDILPTLLYLYDLPVARDMDGKVLTEAFEEKFLRQRPIRFIETYESAKREEKKELTKRDKELDKKKLEELRSLGYIKQNQEP